MKNWINKVLLFLKCGYLDAEVYDNIREDINDANLQMLIRASFLGMIMGIVLFPASFFIDAIAHNKVLYFVIAIVMGGLYIMCKRMERFSQKELVLSFCYIFLGAAFFIALLMGTVLLRDSTATTFCVLLFALPLLLIDRPFRMDLLILLSAIIFCICSKALKSAEVASLDVVNAICFMFLSLFVNHAVLRVKLRDLANTRLIQAERDTDNLTRLYSRSATETCIKQYLSTRRALSALFVIDVDNFKQINDNQGHQMGDKALVEVAKSIRGVFRHADISGRFGGDEFIVFLPDVGSKRKTREKAEALQEKLKEVTVADGVRPITLSIGIAHFPSDAVRYEELFHKADEALYLSKEQGKNQFTIYGE